MGSVGPADADWSSTMNIHQKRLTEMAHGGGCGCKLAPAVLQDILKKMPLPIPCADLLVGTETADDAAVYRLNATQAIIATTDFFTPIVDDPFDFGRIAATNALSDVYAMGGRPLFALALVGMPIATIPIEMAQDILAGGAAVCAEAGIPVVGGHSIDTPEPIYGLVAVGLIHPDKVLKNSNAKAGDTLILTKALGVGIFSAAMKKGELDAAGYAAMVASATKLNTVGADLSDLPEVHAMTDVTGFGLLGHLLEMCRGAGLAARLHGAAVPILPGAEALAEKGYATGAAARNWQSYGGGVHLPPDLADWRRGLLCDPQTSGGLLVAVAPDQADAVLQRCHAAGFPHAAIIGEMAAGAPAVTVARRVTGRGRAAHPRWRLAREPRIKAGPPCPWRPCGGSPCARRSRFARHPWRPPSPCGSRDGRARVSASPAAPRRRSRPSGRLRSAPGPEDRPSAPAPRRWPRPGSAGHGGRGACRTWCSRLQSWSASSVARNLGLLLLRRNRRMSGERRWSSKR